MSTPEAILHRGHQSDRAAAKRLSPKFGRDIYEGGSGYWSAFWWIAGLTVLGLLLWLIFKD